MPYHPNRQCPSNYTPYVIRPGDTFYKIAQRFNITLTNLLLANPGINPNYLSIGQIICIPLCPPNHFAVTIRPGDTLYKIAQTYNTNVLDILSANPGVDPYFLRIGQSICVPHICPSGYLSYTVKSGDTLYSIATEHSVTLQALISANPQITDPNVLSIGQKLCVPASDVISAQLNQMTLEEKIGQMLIVGFTGYTATPSISTLIRDYHIGGIIIYGYNVRSANQLLNLINALKNINSVNKIPLFISVDEEGGRVSRMPPEFYDLPSNEIIGRVNNASLSYQIGNVIAEQISAFGFNMDFAPVLDINSNPNNPVIGDRSFGSNAQIVSRLGVQTMKGIQAGGVIPVVKHYPGHGDTSIDSHIGLPVLSHDLNRLRSFELIPFNEAIRNGADAIMVAHILLYKIDAIYPASLSRTIITDILRNQSGFNGVVITDDMSMGAIDRNFDIGTAAIISVNAGSDIILISGDYNNELKVINALKYAVQNGIISQQRIDESVFRILRLKSKYNVRDTIISSINVNRINNDIQAVLQQIGI